MTPAHLRIIQRIARKIVADHRTRAQQKDTVNETPTLKVRHESVQPQRKP